MNQVKSLVQANTEKCHGDSGSPDIMFLFQADAMEDGSGPWRLFDSFFQSLTGSGFLVSLQCVEKQFKSRRMTWYTKANLQR